jgi:hypothetical protein
MTTPGLLDHLTQASHISAGLGCTFREALEIVKAAGEYEAKREAHNEWANVIYVDFMNKKPKDATRGTL